MKNIKSNIFLLLLLVSFATAQFTEDWNQYSGDASSSDNSNLGDGNTALFTDYSSGLAVSDSDYRTGDVNGDLLAEIVSISTSGTRIYVHNLSMFLFVNQSVSSHFTQILSLSLSDVDGDSVDEIFVIGTNASRGMVVTYEMSGNSLSVKNFDDYSNTFQDVHPVCEGSTCYFIDTTEEVYKYNANTGALLDTVNIMTSGELHIDDCTGVFSGDELMISGNNEVGFINKNTFATGFSQALSGNRLSTCNIENGKYYVYRSEIITTTGGGCGIGCSFQDTFAMYKYEIVNSGTNILNKTKDTSSSWGGSLFGCVQAYACNSGNGWGQPIITDIDENGVQDVCFHFQYRNNCGNLGANKQRVECFAINQTDLWTTSQTIDLVQDIFSCSLSTPNARLQYETDINSDGDTDLLLGSMYYDYGGNLFNLFSSTVSDSGTMIYAPVKYGNECLSFVGKNTTNNFLNIRLSESLTCDYSSIEPFTQILYQETFGIAAFGLNEFDCFEDSFTEGSLLTTTGVNLDNQWYCYVDNATSTSLSYAFSNDLARINTIRGLTSSIATPVLPNTDSFVTFPAELDLQATDSISFYCDLASANPQNEHFLVFGDDGLSGFPVSFGLTNSSCLNNVSVYEGLVSTDCCTLIDVTGLDCSAGKQFQNFTIQQAINACPSIGELNFQDVDRIDLWRNTDNSSDTYYFDDLRITRYNVVGNNTIAFVIFSSPIPSEALVNETVEWSVSIGDAEDLPSQIWSAFDCDITTSLLDYGFAKRGVSPLFECVYGAVGTFTSKAFSSDDNHYPLFNNSLTNSVEIVNDTDPQQGGSCDGFIAPLCPDTNCLFYDDFSYTNPITCNGWGGVQLVPQADRLRVTGITVSDQLFLDQDISINDWKKVRIQFDFSMEEIQGVKLINVFNDDISLISLYLAIFGDDFEVVDGVAPTVNVLTNLNLSQFYTYRGDLDFEAQTVDNYINGNFILTTDFFDTATPINDIGRLIFDFSQPLAVDVSFDNFKIVGLEEGNATQVVDFEGNYIYNPDLFCAIDWANETPSFSVENIEDRGYPTGNRLIISWARACLSDTANSTFNLFMDNILITIVVILVLILVVPVLIQMRR